MQPERTEKITVAKTIRHDVREGTRVIGHVIGDSLVNEQGQWVVELDLIEQSGKRGIDVVEGDEFEFAGGTWRVAKVYEPTTAPRGAVAELVRVTRPEA